MTAKDAIYLKLVESFDDSSLVTNNILLDVNSNNVHYYSAEKRREVHDNYLVYFYLYGVLFQRNQEATIIKINSDNHPAGFQSDTQQNERIKPKYASDRKTTKNIAFCSLLPKYDLQLLFFNVFPSIVFVIRLFKSECCLNV